jgi:hypothetical protein
LEAKKKLKEYLTKGVRKIKHRKGYGVHSPFAYAIITEVIEEKVPYYAYATLRKHYTPQSPISYKMACLLLRLSNRFGCRRILELSSDGGYTALPLLMVDSRNEVLTLADPVLLRQTQTLLHEAHAPRLGQIRAFDSIDSLPADYRADFIILNTRVNNESDAALFARLMAHATPQTLFLVKGISPGRPLEGLWDLLCDSDDVEITMDMYDYGLAISRPRFFKQHYVVSF